MNTTKEQYREAQKILNNNPSMRQNGSFGYYSNGDVVMTIFWDPDETKELSRIIIKPNGAIKKQYPQSNRKEQKS